MSIILKQFVHSTVTPVDDAILYQHFDNRAGILAGCTVAINGTSIHVGAGRGVICGRVFQIVAEDVPATLGANLLGRLLIRVDTANSGSPITFVAQAANPLPALTQDDINRGGTVYEMPLATYNVSATAISDITRVAPILSPLSDMVDGKARASGWTANRVICANSLGNLSVTATTTTELSRLSGVTSPVQEQLDGKAAAFSFDSKPTSGSGNAVTSGGVFSAENPAPKTVASSRALALTDVGAFLSCTGAATLTVPTNATRAFPIGTEILIYRAGTGAVGVAAASGVTIRTVGGLTITDRFGIACLKKIGTDEWIIFGNV